jgi:cytochrome c553
MTPDAPFFAEVMDALRSGQQTVVWLGAPTAACAPLVHLSGVAGPRTVAVLGDDDVLAGAWEHMRAIKAPSVVGHASVHSTTRMAYGALSGTKLVVVLAHPTHTCAQLLPFQLKELTKCQMVVLWPHAPSAAYAVEWIARRLAREGVHATGLSRLDTGDAWARCALEVSQLNNVHYDGEQETHANMPDGRRATVVTVCATCHGKPPANIQPSKRDFFLAHTHHLDAAYAAMAPRVVCACDEVVQYLRKSRHWKSAHQTVTLRAACAEFPNLKLDHAVVDFPVAPEPHEFALACSAAWDAGATSFRRTVWFHC